MYIHQLPACKLSGWIYLDGLVLCAAGRLNLDSGVVRTSGDAHSNMRTSSCSVCIYDTFLLIFFFSSYFSISQQLHCNCVPPLATSKLEAVYRSDIWSVGVAFFSIVDS